MEDKHIIELFFERSEQAIGELAKKYGKLIYKVADNILRNADDAEECENDTYLACWDSIPPEYPNRLMSYVCRIARNKAISKYRTVNAKKRNSLYDVSLDELTEFLTARETADDKLQAEELGQAINSFLSELKKEDRIMFVRRYWFSDSVADIAKLVDSSENRISVHLFRIKEKLYCYLKKEGLL